jgi:hypothetical protein
MSDPITETPAATPAENLEAPSHEKRTEKEKAEFSLKKTAERLRELGGKPEDILGATPPAPAAPADEVPEWYRKLKTTEAQQTALQMADQIPDESERAQVKTYLESRIVPSGNPQADFALAFGAVRAAKNREIVEELGRRITPNVTAPGGSGPTPPVEEPFTPTPEEADMMKPPFKLTKEQILEARKKSQR